MKKVLAPGVFDVFHIGHLNYLKAAASYGDYLIVAIQEDRAVEEAKGAVLVHSLPERVALIEQLRFVDEVVSYIDVFQGPLLETLGIDVFACGEEYGHDPLFPHQNNTIEYCKSHNIEVARIPRTQNVSSTAIRSKLKSFWLAHSEKTKDCQVSRTTLGSFGGDQEKIREETQREIALVRSAIPDSDNRTLIDLGCGDARLLGGLAPHFKESTGVDFVPGYINSAQKALSKMSNPPRLIIDDVVNFKEERHFDVFLLSGITPCLDDLQVQTLLGNISEMANSASRCLVRTSVALTKRINVINQFSRELGTTYTAYYRTVDETNDLFSQFGWHSRDNFLLYQHRADTAVWWFDFERSQ